MGVVGVAMVDAELRAKHFRDAENSFGLEGCDLSGDAFYQELKGRVIAGEIDGDEMMRRLLADSKAKQKSKASELAIAG